MDDDQKESEKFQKKATPEKADLTWQGKSVESEIMEEGIAVKHLGTTLFGIKKPKQSKFTSFDLGNSN